MKVVGVVYVDTLTTIQAQTNALLLGFSKKFDIGAIGVNKVQSPFIVCEYCNRPNLGEVCGNVPQATDYVNNPNRQGNPFCNTYNPGWGNHPNFAWIKNQAGN